MLFYAGLSLIGLELAIFFAVLGALFEFVHYIGPTVAAIPAIAFALADSFELALLTLLLFLVVNQVEGNVLIPMIMSQAVKLHPAVIAIVVVVVGLLFGPHRAPRRRADHLGLLIVGEELWVKPSRGRAGAARRGAADRAGRAAGRDAVRHAGRPVRPASPPLAARSSPGRPSTARLSAHRTSG